MIRGVLFDMDGLMFDTEALGLKGWKAAGRKIGIEITDDMIASFRGLGSSEKRKRFGQVTGKPELYEAALAIRTNYGDEWIRDNGIPIKPGLKQLLVFCGMQVFRQLLQLPQRGKKQCHTSSWPELKSIFLRQSAGRRRGHQSPHRIFF